ncbi:MAG: dipeptidase [Myxococcaceae bacterium]|nr:dipeptidase [Myxococcaceae bacterium]MCI0670614.1 dipeptidase [Myxococcaceae bacterium]
MRVRRKWLVFGLPLLLVGAVVGMDYAASEVDRKLNRVHARGRFSPTARTAEVHGRQTIVDLHADPLLWGRDLNARGTVGHVDVPRLLEGNVALQVFGVVTKTPRNLNIERNDDRTDEVLLLALAQRWPPMTLGSLLARAQHQAALLQEASEGSGGALRVIRTRADLTQLLEGRRKQRRQVGALLALEGMHALEGKLENVDTLHRAGFRMLGLTHFFDNEVAGSAHGVEKGGLSDLGRAAISRMEQLGITVDLAHASERAMAEALSIARRPVVVSHTGVRGTCNNKRNLSDAQLRAIARNGGVVGIGYWQTAVCGDDAKAIARAVLHAVKVAGVDHVALGSDFDGATSTPFDSAGLTELTQALLDAGLSEEALGKVMGGNALRVLERNLPEE